MLPPRVRICFLAVATFIWIAGETAHGQDMWQYEDSMSSSDDQNLPQHPQPTWHFEFANDALSGADSQFTNGITIQKHSTAAYNLSDFQGVRAFGRGLARRMLPQDSDLVYRNTLVVGQNMATPDGLENPDVILDDTPYLGLLAVGSSWIGFNDTEFTGFGITAGIVGPWSGAEQVQTSVHSLIGATDPQGWAHQLDNEPVINFYFTKKRKLWDTPSFDGAFNVNLSVGNFHTGLDAGIEMRFGRKPGGFSNATDPIGRGMAYDATLPRQNDQTELYGTLAIRAWAWAIFMPLDGNTFVSGNEWTDNNTIEPKHLVGQAIVGLHYVRPKWGVHATWTFATDNVGEASLVPGTDAEDNFGIITFEWRF